MIGTLFMHWFPLQVSSRAREREREWAEGNQEKERGGVGDCAREQVTRISKKKRSQSKASRIEITNDEKFVIFIIANNARTVDDKQRQQQQQRQWQQQQQWQQQRQSSPGQLAGACRSHSQSLPELDPNALGLGPGQRRSQRPRLQLQLQQQQLLWQQQLLPPFTVDNLPHIFG